MAPVELLVERVAAGGDSIAHEDSGRVVFVRGALPGERVRASITEEHRDYARATVVDVLHAAPERRACPCPYVAAGCGGCGWQHVEPEAQVALKLAIVAEALRRTGGQAGARVVSGPALDPFAFRTTLRLGVGEDGRPGFRAARSHRIVEVAHCLVAHPRLDEVIAVARFPGASEVVLRCGAATGDRLAVVLPTGATRRASLPDDVHRGPRSYLHEVVDGHRLRVSARSFFQSRADGAEALVALVREAAAGALGQGLLVDAYGGVGLFAATVDPGAEVEVVETSRVACADAAANLADRAAVVTCVDVARWRARQAAVVVADPARAGLGRPAAGRLAASGASRLVLVSCDPVSLARDTRLLADLGYDHVESVVVDLFPQTPHVEVVTRFDRR